MTTATQRNPGRTDDIAQCAVRVVAAIAVAVPLATLAGPFDSIKGSWRGAVQIDETAQPAGHTVGTLDAHIGADGAFDAVHASGCKLRGVVQLYAGKTIFKVDLRMSACPFSPYNRRWTGQLTFPNFSTMSLALNSSDLPVPFQKIQGRVFDAKGTLSR